MSDYLPERREPSMAPVASARLAWQRHLGEVSVARHAVREWTASQKDQIDSYALSDAITCATDEELRFLDEGIRLAAGSAAKAELVARKAELLSNLNNRRIARRFGR